MRRSDCYTKGGTPVRGLTTILLILFLLLPSSGLCLSDRQAFELLLQQSKEVPQFPFHVYISSEYEAFEGTPLPVSIYEFFVPWYDELRYNEPDEIFTTYHFSQGARWICFLLRVPNMYTSNAISLLIFDKERGIWQKPLKIAEWWGDAGYSIDVQAWIEDIDNDGTFAIVKRTKETEEDLVSDIPKPPSVKKKENVLIWDKDHFRDASRKYLPKLNLMKYQFNEEGKE